MTDAHSTGPQTAPVNVAAKIGWAILIAATLYVCYFSHLGAIGFVGPDEPRYAWIARDMAETGDWVTPRLYGKPWFEKPPLFYWGAAICFKLFGVSEAAARLPSAICALLATLVLAWLAWKMYGAETARCLLLLLPTTVGMIGFSHAAATDMPFSGMLTIAMVCAAVILRLAAAEQGGSGSVLAGAAPPDSAPTPPLASASSSTQSQTPWLALVLFGFFLGLAVLAKGPAAIILSGGAVFFWALFTKRWRDAFRLLHPAAIAAFCTTALPWYIVCAQRNPDFFRTFIIEHNFKRYLTPEFQHIQPFWFYSPIVLLAFLPWTAVLLWSSTCGTLRVFRERRISPSAAFFVTWSLFCLVFFSISQSKLPGYILPAIPALGLCMARVFVAMRSVYPLSLRISELFASAALLVVGSVFMLFGRASHQGSAKAIVAYGVVAALLGLANLVVGLISLPRRHDGIRAIAGGFAVLPILLLLLLCNGLLPSFFFWDPSGRTLARELQARGIPSDAVSALHMRRALQFSMNFYLHNETKSWNRDIPTAGFLVVGAHTCKPFVPTDWRCEEIPFDVGATGYFLYKVGPDDSAVGGTGGSGSRSGDTDRRQPQ